MIRQTEEGDTRGIIIPKDKLVVGRDEDFKKVEVPLIINVLIAAKANRYFNVLGPKQNPSSEYTAVIPKFITRVVRKQPPIIYGDGNQTRDFTFVKDVVRANILAMERDAKGIFNVAYGKRTSINELASKIMETVSLEMEPVHDKTRPGDIRHSLADISLAKDKLGYKPEYSLEEGLEETIKWFQKNFV